MRYILSTLTLLSALLVSCGKQPAVEESVPVTSVSISPSSIELTEGETLQLSASVLPATATDKSVVWSSSVPSVASVSSSGVVTAVKEGETVITARAGSQSAQCKVSVKKKQIAVTGISLDKSTLSLVKYESAQLTATVLPEDATDKTVTWSSTVPSIASVDETGTVKALAGGKAVITAQVGDFTASCTVTVTVPVASVTLNHTSISIEAGKSMQLIATVLPEDATDKTVTWSSSDETIATVEKEGKVIGHKGGSVTVTAKAGDQTVTCSVTVTQNGSNENEGFGGGNGQWDDFAGITSF